MVVQESILDFPQETLNPKLWCKLNDGSYDLRDDARQTIQEIVDWAQKTFQIPQMNVNITGSNASNSYSDSSDIDIHFNSPKLKVDKADEFNQLLRKKFEELVARRPDLEQVNGVKAEVYMQANPSQDMMSVGCYDFLNRKWLVGPELKDINFDPYVEYFTKDMKNVDDVIDDVRSIILQVYELAIALIKTNDVELKEKLAKKLHPLVKKASAIYTRLREKRKHKSTPADDEEALKYRDDDEWKLADSTFKLLDKFGYLAILKACAQSEDRFSEDMSDIETAMNQVVATISDKISVHALDDSEQKFIGKLLEMEQANESASSMMKIAAVAALMSIGAFLPADALAKELRDTKQVLSSQSKKMTKDSLEVKRAVSKAAKDNQMLGTMRKANVVNAVAKVLWKEARGEGEAGVKAVASVIANRCGNDPKHITNVLKQKKQFSCLNDYAGGWNDRTYQWFNPRLSDLKSSYALKMWDFCKNVALEVANGTFKSTIGNRNVYANEALSDQSNVDSWVKDCDLEVGNHKFGYRKEYDPTIVKPGTFTLQKKASQMPKKLVVVKKGQTISSIAKEHGITANDLAKLNPDLKDPDKISIGQKLRVE